MQRALLNSIAVNPLRTLFIATEGVPLPPIPFHYSPVPFFLASLPRIGLEAPVRLLLVPAMIGVFFVCSPASTGQKTASEQPDISRSGRDFLEVCASVDSKGGVDSEGNKDTARIQRDATCLGWVEGFADGFLVYGELLSVPRKDRMACVPRGVTALQIVHVIKKYLADNPEKAHRPTRYVVSIALAGTFPCKAGK